MASNEKREPRRCGDSRLVPGLGLGRDGFDKISPGRGALLSGLFRLFDELHGQLKYPSVFEFDGAAIGARLKVEIYDFTFVVVVAAKVVANGLLR